MGLDHTQPRHDRLQAGAEVVARFIHLVWGTASPREYAPRTYEMLMSLKHRMRGMPPEAAWDYALSYLARDIRSRLAKAATLTIDPEMETALTHRFFDSIEDYHYLHDVAQKIMHLHWQRRHGPEPITYEEVGRSKSPPQPRGVPTLERHLRRMALEGLATYIEQSNIARGNIEEPTDPLIVFRDRVELQQGRAGRDARTEEESAWQIADLIERQFGTAAARKDARSARILWEAPKKVGQSTSYSASPDRT